MRSAVLLLALPLAACVSDDNPALSDGTRLSTTVAPSDTPTYAQPDAPSVTGLSRDQWALTNFSVPQREVLHKPTYRSRPVALTDSNAIQRDEFPTAENAGAFSLDSQGDQRVEALLAPMYALADILLLVPRAIMMPPTTPVRGPTIPVDRVPAPAPAPVTVPVTPAPPAPDPAPATNTPPEPINGPESSAIRTGPSGASAPSGSGATVVPSPAPASSPTQTTPGQGQ